MLLNVLVKKMDKNAADYEQLVQALDKMKEIAEYINEKVPLVLNFTVNHQETGPRSDSKSWTN